MTVPDAVSAACELRRCHDCGGVALSGLTDRIAPCTCLCHRSDRKAHR